MELVLNSPRALFLSTRPQSLVGALIPVLLGSCLAFSHDSWDLTTALLCAGFAASLQVTANMINDYYDLKKGADVPDKDDMGRVYANGWITLKALGWITALSAFMAVAFAAAVFSRQHDLLPYQGWELVGMAVLCLLGSVLYSSFFSYAGMGDVLVLFFFGLVPVCGTYYLQAHTLSTEVVALSLISGVVIDTMLAINNYRDMEIDREHHKNTLVVRCGKTFGKWLYLALGIAAALLTLLLACMGTFSLWSALGIVIIYLTLHTATWQQMLNTDTSSNISAILYGGNARNMTLMGLLLSAAILWTS